MSDCAACGSEIDPERGVCEVCGEAWTPDGGLVIEETKNGRHDREE